MNGAAQGPYRIEIAILSEKGFLAWLKYKALPGNTTDTGTIALHGLAERNTGTKNELVNLLATLIGNNPFEP